MALVYIPAQLREMTGDVRQLELDVPTVGAAVDELESRFPGIRERLCADGELRHSLRVSVDNSVDSRGLRAKLKADSEVHFIPAIGGG